MRVAILSGALFLSGISALIFETLWLRLAGLAFGNSVWSAALILSSFMAGLALGNAIAGMKRVRRIRPLHAYILLEVTIGLVGCGIVFVLPSIGESLQPVFRALWEHQTLLLALRFVVSFGILLVPTTAMGLTLPLVVGDRLLDQYRFGPTIGVLYGANTLGAVAGAIVGEAYLIQAFGLTGTAVAAGLANLAAAALALSLVPVASPVMPPPDLREESNDARGVSRTIPWQLLFVSFSSGFLLLCLEVVWFRFLRLYVASTNLAFAVMLAVVLAGIALGGLASAVVQRRWSNAGDSIPSLLLLASIATVLSYVLFPTSVRSSAGPFDIDDWRVVTVLSAALMFPVAFLSGVLFPTVISRANDALTDRASSTGLTTVANTIGATAGPLAASFLLLPLFGFQTTLLLCAAGYAVVALCSTSELRQWLPTSSRATAQIALLAVVIGLLLFFPKGRDEGHFAHARQLFSTEGSYLVKKIDGTTDTLQLLRRDVYGESYYYQLLTNSFSMSATSPPSQRYMRLFAYLPLFLNPEARDALLICYGCGVTADALARAPQLHHVDAVDISREVFALAPDYVSADYHNPLLNPKVTSSVQDGRFYLRGSPHQYDVITGEPPPLKTAGTVNLYTKEFFSLMRSRLRDGGIATFWLPIYQLTPDETKAILRAFYEVFPNASLWSGLDNEWIMLGVNGERPRLATTDLSRLWNDASTSADLKRIGLELPNQMASLFLMDSEEIVKLTEGVAPLVDNYPKRLGDSYPEDAVTYRFAWKYLEGEPALQRFVGSKFTQSVWPAITSEELKPFFLQREDQFLARVAGANPMAELDLYLRYSQLRYPVLTVLGTDATRVEIAKRVTQRGSATTAEALPDLVADALADRRIRSAIELLETKAPDALRREDILLLIYLYCLDGRVDAAEKLAEQHATHLEKDRLVDWLWTKLQTDFGFHPPASG